MTWLSDALLGAAIYWAAYPVVVYLAAKKWA